jgi:hypothetical protein
MIRIKTGTLISVGINFRIGETEAFDTAITMAVAIPRLNPLIMEVVTASVGHRPSN